MRLRGFEHLKGIGLFSFSQTWLLNVGFMRF